MPAQRVTLQPITHHPIQPLETLAHVCGSRRQIDPCRRPKAEHRLQPLQHSHQSRQRRRIKAGANFDSAARADNDRQSYYRLLPSCRIHGWQLHCNQTAASTCAPSFLSFPQITIQSIQHYSVPAAKLARPQAALNKLFHHLLDRQCTATRTPHRNLLFAHANTSPQQPAIKQVRCSHAYEEVKAGTPVRVEVSAPDLKNWSSNEIVLQPGQSFIVSDISLGVATVEMAVNAATPEQVAVEQVKIEEQQRVFGVIPNFFVSYERDAAPLTSKLKFQLAMKTLTDPVTIIGFGMNSAIYQAAGYPSYRQGAAGYGERLGSTSAGGYSKILLGDAVFPSLFHQDPRYFYQGTGTTKSRLLHAMATPFFTRGDDGKREINYSNLLGDLASGALANAYYPSQDRGAGLVVRSAAIGIGGRMVFGIVQEFVLHKRTTHHSSEP